MTSALIKLTGRTAATVALGLFAVGATPAFAADLGGNCCADLEERIAELEATTARKGNRKVSLTVTGWVNEAVFFWDDGVEKNIYVGTNDLERTRLQFVGKAKITDDVVAGYRLELGFRGNNSSKFDQDSDALTNAVDVRHAVWYLESKTLGKLSVGQTGSATYHLLDDADITNTRNFADAEAAPVAQGAFFLRSGGKSINGLRWTDVMRGFNNSTPGQAGRREIVKYDSPTLAGFSVTAAWGDDDLGDVALTYKGDIQDFKLAFKAGYGQASDEGTERCHTAGGSVHQDCEWWGVAGTVMHAPTGLYVYAGYGEQQDNTRGTDPKLVVNTVDSDTAWFVQGGIEKGFFPLGKTTVFGEFRHDDAGSNVGKSVVAGGSAIRESSLDFIGAGVVQNVEAAAMDLYVIYRHAEGDTTDFTGAKTNLDDFDMVMTGAMIRF